MRKATPGVAGGGITVRLWTEWRKGQFGIHFAVFSKPFGAEATALVRNMNQIVTNLLRFEFLFEFSSNKSQKQQQQQKNINNNNKKTYHPPILFLISFYSTVVFITSLTKSSLESMKKT